MKTDFLKALGLEQPVIEAILKENGLDIEKHKSAAAREKARADDLQGQLTSVNKKLDGFAGVDVAALQKEAADWKAAAERAKADAAEEMNRERLSDAINAELQKAKCRNAALVIPMLKTEGLSFEGGEVKGLKEQISALQKSGDTSFLFEPAKATGMRQFGGDGITNVRADANQALREWHSGASY